MNPQIPPPSPNRGFESLPVRHCENEEEPGKPGKSKPPEWFAAHDAAWRTQFIRPLAAFMMQRDVAHLRLDLVEDKVRFALIAKGESVEVYELVDATDEGQYFPLGVFFDYASAEKAAQTHHPRDWEEIVDTEAFVEIRARKIGLSGGIYAVLWRGEWHYDYEAHEWKLLDEQTGTLEKPLPLTRL